MKRPNLETFYFRSFLSGFKCSRVYRKIMVIKNTVYIKYIVLEKVNKKVNRKTIK